MTFDGKSESVRDVQFNPVLSTDFACAFENGTVHKWDMRAPKIYEKKLSAHNGLVLSIDWHPEGRYLASGGRDKLIKIWDMQSEQRKPSYHIQTLASISRIQWSPMSYLSSYQAGTTNYNQDFHQKSFIASCSLVSDNRIHIWDLDRPHVPVYTFESHTSPSTGCLWRDQFTLYSVSKDETFVVNTFPTGQNKGSGFRPTDFMSCTSLSWNCAEDMVVSSRINSGTQGSVGTTGEGIPIDEKSISRRTYNDMAVNSGSPLLNYFLNGPNSNSPNFVESNSLTWAGSSVPTTLSSAVAGQSFESEIMNNPNIDRISHRYSDTPANLEEFDSTYKSTVSSYFSRRIAPRKPTMSSGLTNASQSLKKPIKTGHFSPEHYQKLSVMESRTFDPDVFSTLAGKFNLLSNWDDLNRLAEICLENSNVCQSIGEDDKSKFWEIMSIVTLYQKDYMEYFASNTENSSQEPFSLKDMISKIQLKQLDFKDFFLKTFNWYLDQGDVQTCVYLVLLFGRCSSLAADAFTEIPRSTLEQVFISYIEILQRFQLFIESTAIINNTEFESIRNINQKSTSFYTSCARCFKPILTSKNQKGYWCCDRCGQMLPPCSICKLPVKGVFVTCNICGHGGHIKHLKEWFKRNRECPTGCGHICVFDCDLNELDS